MDIFIKEVNNLIKQTAHLDLLNTYFTLTKIYARDNLEFKGEPMKKQINKTNE